MNILGISCFYHDAAAALLQDGVITAAAEEERFTRKKHDSNFPKNAVEYCLGQADLTSKDLDCAIFYEKPFLKFERVLETAFHTAPRGFTAFSHAALQLLHEKLWVANLIKKELGGFDKILFSGHHLSHAASAFYASPFKRAALLTIDGVGEWDTSTEGIGVDKEIHIERSIHFPHSLGLLYSAFTQYLGFKVNSGEYKVMGLAPNGKPEYYDVIKKNLIEIEKDGSFKLNLKYFGYLTDLQMINPKFSELFGRPPREPESKLEQFHSDVARSIQLVTEEVMLNMASHLRDSTGEKFLCMAGGVALNCVANGRILRESGFEDIYIQPGAGDSGGAIGAAALAYHQHFGKPRVQLMKNAYLGPEYFPEKTKRILDEVDASYEEFSGDELLKETAKRIHGKRVVGWFQGRMEFGPRALGNRSIVADPTDPAMKDVLNEKIKLREGFRPFAPSVLEDKVSEYFELDRPSPYMLLVAKTREEYVSKLPAITHVDGTARIQTVNRGDNPLYYDLILEFSKLSGVHVVVNTSFNVRGEPIVLSPLDAFRCFMRTKMDSLVVGNYVLDKEKQGEFTDDFEWHKKLALD